MRRGQSRPRPPCREGRRRDPPRAPPLSPPPHPARVPPQQPRRTRRRRPSPPHSARPASRPHRPRNTIRRDVEVAQCKAHDLLESGGGCQLSPVGGLWFVERNERHVFGIRGGGEPYERGNVLVAVGARRWVDLLGGPCLAGHGVTGNLGVFARPFVDDALQHPAYYSRGLLAYHPGSRLRGGVALPHVRGDPTSPVGDSSVA